MFWSDEFEQLGLREPILELLQTQNYRAHILEPAVFADCLSDLSALDELRRCEFGVFPLGSSSSPVHFALALAQALAKPAFRLQRRDIGDAPCQPDVHGLLPWWTPQQLLPTLKEQFECYARGFLEVVLREPTRVLDELLTRLWDPRDPRALVNFIDVGDPHLQGDLYLIRKRLQQGSADLVAEGRYAELCQVTYEQIQSHDWLYEFEPGEADYSRQRIRLPREMHANRVGTCLDFACLFAALLENMQANPVILKASTTTSAHALAGCWPIHPPGLAVVLDRERIRTALCQDELLLFETTGAARSRHPVAGEQRDERQMLDFSTARESARQFLTRSDVAIDFLVDVLAARTPE
jgi:hypothetical protein